MINNYNQIIGHKLIIDMLTNMRFQSVIFEGHTGIGKTSLARAYIHDKVSKQNPSTPVQEFYDCGVIKEVNATYINTDFLRSFRGQILLLDEIQYLSKRQQQLLLEPLEHDRFVLIATTTEPVNQVCHPALVSRCRRFPLKYPTTSEIKEGLSRLYPNVTYESDDVIMSIISNNPGDLRRVVGDIENLSTISSNITKELVENYYDKVVNNEATVSSLKSALQKSIRGSDPDAACIYALTLLQIGELETVCRRLRVICSEDIGLADSNVVTVVESCINNALVLGMPECQYPIIHAVLLMALSPKSNSVATTITNFESLDLSKITPPSNIAYGHAKDYLYPHNYSNHWVRQNYHPLAYYGLKLYHHSMNTQELGYKSYWESVKERS